MLTGLNTNCTHPISKSPNTFCTALRFTQTPKREQLSKRNTKSTLIKRCLQGCSNSNSCQPHVFIRIVGSPSLLLSTQVSPAATLPGQPCLSPQAWVTTQAALSTYSKAVATKHWNYLFKIKILCVCASFFPLRKTALVFNLWLLMK